ncbi:MAG: hypothetical protein KBD10_02675 [Candidatus Pacebacteria bacterium]|nr:hypothetical protein [Candidatus Paceibacterota bacterium]
MKDFIEAVYRLRNETMKLHPTARIKSIRLDEGTVRRLDNYFYENKFSTLPPPLFIGQGERKLFDIDIIEERFEK